jgi:hypothetical protein
MTKFSEYLQDKSDSRNLERLQKEIQRLRRIDKRRSENVEARYIAETKTGGVATCWLPGHCNN